MSSPSISIITVNLNNQNGLRATFDSIFSQTYKHFEYIVVDGNSEDGSTSLIESYKTSIDILIEENDNGVYNAMNKGIAKASGDYILFLNSGDYLIDNHVLENISAFIDSTSSHPYDIIYGNLLVKRVDGTEIMSTYPEQLTLDFFLAGSLPHPSSFISRKLFNKIGVYREDFSIVSDWIFFFQAFMHPDTRFCHLDMSVAVFEEGGLSSSFSNYNTLQHERKLALKHIMPGHLLNLLEEYRIVNHKYQKLHIDFFYTLFVRLRSLLMKLLRPYLYIQKGLTRSYNSLISTLSYSAFKRLEYKRSKGLPVIINNRNRLSTLRALIRSLEERGINNIFIIDNASTYPPLLEFYSTTKYKVYRLKKNAGFCALWDTYIFNDFKDQEYVYTDSDVVLSKECDADVLCRMLFLLKRYPSIDRIGLGLRTDDLPDHYQFKQRVIEWEKIILKGAKEIENNVFVAPVDTTFALYRRNKKGPAGFIPSVRVQTNNMIQHLPWYIDMHNLSEEESYYLKHANTKNYTHWTAEAKELVNSSIQS